MVQSLRRALHSNRVINYIGLIAPALFVGYGYLISIGVVPSQRYHSDWLFYTIGGAWCALAVLQCLYAGRSARFSATWLGLYHLFTSGYVLAVSGFVSPLITCWAILLVATQQRFGDKGVYLSIGWLMLTAVLDIALMQPAYAAGDLVAALFSVLVLLISGLALVNINRIQDVDRSILAQSRAKERIQRERILTIINNLVDAVISTDTQGIIRLYNAASLNLLDTNGSLNGQHIDAVLPLRDRTGHPVAASRLLRDSHGVAIHQDLYYEFVGGDHIRLEATMSPIRGGNTNRRAVGADGYVMILRDITRAKSLEEERDEFISVVSHELRTPITIAEGAISNTQLLLGRSGAMSEVIDHSITTAHDQVVFLARMVNDLSTLSRAERGVADAPELIDLTDLARLLTTRYTPVAAEKNLQLLVKADLHPGSVNTSRLYLEELLQNLITNAIKYTIEGSVTVGIHRRDDTVEFVVSDTGIGISKADQRRIFDKFFRVEDYRTRQTSGTGLGLYVAAKLASKMGTQISVDGHLNQGSTFRFSLPLAHQTTPKPD